MDYICLCGLDYDKIIMQQISGDDISCSNTTNSTTKDLNYPSFTLKAPHPNNHISGSFKRTVVTNVGSPTFTYRAFLTAPNELDVSSVPDVLSFSSLGEQQTYVLTINGALRKESTGSASLVWDDVVFHPNRNYNTNRFMAWSWFICR
ncbi:putative cucumisin [Medicago truncatula]|nr:putative cucumisin [Medicago truncatula]